MGGEYRMNTGFENLNKIFDIAQAQLVLFTGNPMVDILSGDIANNICLHQDDNFGVLEIVSTKKEYLIKRLCVNEADVNYRKWTLKNCYSDEELKQIGQKMVDLIETTDRLPTIIDECYCSGRKVAKIVYDYANCNADRDDIRTIAVIDICPFNRYILHKHVSKKMWRRFRERCECLWFVKKMQKYSKRYNFPIIIVCKNTEILKGVSKYADRVLKCGNIDDDGNLDVEIIEEGKMVGKSELRYNWEIRRFEDCGCNDNK